MSNFDTVRAINIAHDKFNSRHNGLDFQTKDLGPNLSEYCIFNGILYQQYNGENSVRHNNAVENNYSGELNIYTIVSSKDFDYWVEYDLVFESGRLIDVVFRGERVKNDKRDLSNFRPCLPDNRVRVTLNIDDLDTEQQNLFIESIEHKLDAIREIIGQPKATIFYPAKPYASSVNSPFTLCVSRIKYLASVVQTMDAFKGSEKQVHVTAPNGDRVNIILDEF